MDYVRAGGVAHCRQNVSLHHHSLPVAKCSLESLPLRESRRLQEGSLKRLWTEEYVMILILVRHTKVSAAVSQIRTNLVKGHIHAGLLVDQRSGSEWKQLYEPRSRRRSQPTRSAESHIRQQNDIGNRNVDFDNPMGLERRLVPYVLPFDVIIASTSPTDDRRDY
jgi:hypothetical protein